MKLRFLPEHYTQLKTQLIMDTSVEQGCFALVKPIQLGTESLFLVKEIIPLSSSDFSEQADDFLSFKPEVMLKVVRQAQKLQLSILMIHTHPACDQYVDFSKADDLGNLESFKFFYRMLPEGMHGCLVFSGTFNSVAGRIYQPNLTWNVLEQIEIVGKPFLRQPSTFDSHQFDRQARLLGKDGQGILSNLTVAIVGCGGIGSLVAMNLAQSGVGHLILIDHDVVETSNLPRLVGASPNDALQKTPKVEVIQRYIGNVAPTCKVSIFQYKTEDLPEDVIALADAVVCATDTALSRHVLTGFSNRFYVPLLDLGVEFVANKLNGELVNEIGKVNLIFPTTPCLWCSGHVSAELLRRESLSGVALDQERKAGYIANLDVPDPSMMPFNMLIAARGCQLLIGNFTGLLETDPLVYEQFSMLGLNGRQFYKLIQKRQNPECPLCNQTL